MRVPLDDQGAAWSFGVAGAMERAVEYTGAKLRELDLAWATTVHKAQGGESPVVVLLLSLDHEKLLTRRLLYTGASQLSTPAVRMCTV